MVLIYSLLAKLIGLVFSLVSQILLLIDNLSKYNFFSVKTVNDFTTKVYVIVGVLMLFKLVISAIQYIVNPDNFSDKNKGLGSILTKSVIVVALLALVPTIFDFALDVQNTIVDAIPNVIFGNNATSTNKNFDSVGEQISVSILTGFLTPISGKTATIPVNKVDDFEKAATEGCDASILTSAWLLGTNCVNDKWWVLALPIGIFLIVTLIAMAADVGIRTIKFGIVQILAPIPIVSYISDEKKFNNWVTTSLQIYADLFVRMGIIYFVIYFIKVVLQDFLTTTGYPQEFASSIGRTPQPMEIIFVKVFIVIALIMFAKNAPKFITDLLGIKGADDSIGNMFKRAGGIFRGATSGVRDTIAGGINRYNKVKSDPKYKDHKGKQIATALKSAAMTGRHSAWASTKAVIGGKGYKEVGSISQTAAKRAYDLREARRDAGVGWWKYHGEIAKNRMGIQSSLEANNAEIKAAQESSDKSKAALDYVLTNISTKYGLVRYDSASLSKVQSAVSGDPLAASYYNATTKKFDIGIDSTGTSIGIDLNDASVANNIVKLQSITNDTTGKYTDENKARAGRLLDLLAGEAEVYIANNAYNESVVGKPNEAFLRILEEAQNSILVNSATQFGVDTKKTATDKGLSFDQTGHVNVSQLGDWLAINKKAGQRAQRENIRANASQGAAAAAKQIADKYDNKK